MEIRFGRTAKVVSLVPLAALSMAWTVSLAGVGAGPTTASADGPEEPVTLPDGTSVPEEAIEAPASVSRGAARRGRSVIGTSSTSGIPSAALAAYQRAETIINAADESCNLPWQLVAAIGRVESDHGRYGGNVLDSDGVARPGIYGIALDGSRGTARIRDTDAGQHDDDRVWDRAVGPMQFIPSTWSVVGVDADGDGERNPQDVDDAALATAVYLCSGDDDLGTDAGRRAAVFRYNHSRSYVDLVLSVMESYLSGDFMTVPNGTTTSTGSAGYLFPDPDYVAPADRRPRDGGGADGGGSDGGAGAGGDGGTAPVDADPDPLPEEPTGETGETGDAVGDAVEDAEETVREPVEDTTDRVEDTVTRAEATSRCLARGVVDDPLTPADELEQCIRDVMG